MTDFPTQQKEWFSRAFLVGIAASAGYPVEVRLNDVFGVDATVHNRGITVDWQLKGTSSPLFNADATELLFDLDVRTYQLLTEERNTPAYLGVVVMPSDPADWVDQSDERLLLLHCGYWARVTGLSPTANESTIRIHISTENRICVDDIQTIMADERARLLV